MFLSDISIKRPIMMSMLLIVFVFFGAFYYFQMNLEMIPEINLPVVTVQVVYPGANPLDLETQVTKKIEDAVSSVSGINYIESYSMESVSYVMIMFDLNKDVYIAVQEIKDKVDGILNDLPDDAKTPLVQRYDPTILPVVNLVLSGPISKTELYDLADKKLKNRFPQINGVATVGLSGGQKREINVSIDSKTVLQQSVPLKQLAGLLAYQNMDIPGGNFTRRSQEYSVRLNGQFDNVETIRNIEIPTSNGIKKLGYIANVTDTGAEVRERTTYFNVKTQKGNDDVILMTVMKNSGANAVRIYERLEKVLPEIRKNLPKGCNIDIVHENTSFTRAAVNDTMSNIIMGIILTGLILMFFLHDYKSTLIVALSMPMSIISTFLFMKLSGFTLNIMSLMGLSTSVGILTTNSIVVLENIFRYKSLGYNRIESASKGTSDIAIAVLASASTNLVVFLPISALSGMAGILFRQFSLTVVYATIFSIIMSFTLTPMMASIILPDHDRKKHPIGMFLEKIFISWELAYKWSLRWLLKNKIIGFGLILFSIVLLVFSLDAAKKINFNFIANMDEGKLNVMVDLPSGYSLEETARVMNSIESHLKKHNEISHFWTTLGMQSETSKGVNLACINVKLTDVKERTKTSQEMVGILIKDLSDIPNTKIRISSVFSVVSGRQDVEFYLVGQDMDSLKVVNKELISKMKKIPGALNVNSSMRSGKPEIAISPYRNILAETEITTAELALAIRGAVDGIVDTYYKVKGEEYDIRVQLSDETVDSPEKIANIPIVGKSGTYRLSQLASVDFTEGYDTIIHKNRGKAVKLGCDMAPGSALGQIQKEVNKIFNDMHPSSDYKLEWGFMATEMNKTVIGMLVAFIIATILTYMLLAATLENLTQPLIILATIPLGMIGVIWSLLFARLSMDIIAMLSVVMLIGIVVNNAILQLDYTNTLVREKKMSIHDALIEACPTKLKAILMSNIAIILGMLPMAMGMGEAGKEMRQPMGVVSIGGLVVSTIMSLFVIPVAANLIAKKRSSKEDTIAKVEI